jgi:hypothetical protein
MDGDPADEIIGARSYRALVTVLAELTGRDCAGVTDIHDAGSRIPSLAAERHHGSRRRLSHSVDQPCSAARCPPRRLAGSPEPRLIRWIALYLS